jgi:hypothetical protein
MNNHHPHQHISHIMYLMVFDIAIKVILILQSVIKYNDSLLYLNDMKYSPLYSDFTLVAKDGIVDVHKFIMQRSPVIARTLEELPDAKYYRVPFSSKALKIVVEAVYLCSGDSCIHIVHHRNDDVEEVSDCLELNAYIFETYDEALKEYKKEPTPWLRCKLQELVSIYDIYKASKDYPDQSYLKDINITDAYQQYINKNADKWVNDLYYLEKCFRVLPPKRKISVTVNEKDHKILSLFPYSRYFNITLQ